MLEFTRQGEGVADRGSGRLDIDIVDIHKDVATVVVHGGVYREYLHLVRTGDDWKIAAAVVLALAITLGVTLTGLAPLGVVALVGGLLLLAFFVVSLVVDVRR